MSIVFTCDKGNCPGWNPEVEDMNDVAGVDNMLPVFCRCEFPRKNCIFCDEQASYTYPGIKDGLTCEAHANNQMINIKDKKSLRKFRINQ